MDWRRHEVGRLASVTPRAWMGQQASILHMNWQNPSPALSAKVASMPRGHSTTLEQGGRCKSQVVHQIQDCQGAWYDVRFHVAIGVKANLSRTSNFDYARDSEGSARIKKDFPSKLKKFGSFLSLNFP
jgi:hypothetical protein